MVVPEINEELWNESLECTRCTRKMIGVFHYVVRDTCEECGGENLAEYELK